MTVDDVDEEDEDENNFDIEFNSLINEMGEPEPFESSSSSSAEPTAVVDGKKKLKITSLSILLWTVALFMLWTLPMVLT